MEEILKVAQELAKDLESNLDLTEEEKKNPDMSKVFTKATEQMMAMMQDGDVLKKMSQIAPKIAASNNANQVKQIVDNIPETSKHSIEEEDLNDDYVENEEEIIKPKTDNIEYTMEVKLEHLFTGKKKKIALRRSNFKTVDGKVETFEEKKHLIVPIVPGTKHGDIITFNGQADHVPGHVPGDVIVTISEKEPENDNCFYRDEDDLLLTKKIDFCDNYALNTTITHLDGRTLVLDHPIGQAIVVHTEESEDDRGNGIRKIVGEGMPVKNTNKRGDLYIRFDLVIPPKLPEDQALKLKDIFQKSPVEGEKVTLEPLGEDELSEISDDELTSDYSDDDDDFLAENNDDENLSQD